MKVFCRCCGKEIHRSARTCPQCGGLQGMEEPVAPKAKEPGLWISIAALTFAIFNGLALLDFSDGKMLTHNEIVGTLTFVIVSVVLGSVSIRKQYSGRKMAIAAVMIAAMSLLSLFGAIYQ